MMTNLIPKACFDEIQKFKKNFIWGDKVDKKWFHAIKWENLTYERGVGELGLRDLGTMNKACLVKLNRQLVMKLEDPRCLVLNGLYGKNGQVDYARIRPSHSILWKAFCNGMPTLQELGIWSIGNGSKVSAWTDIWIEPGLCIADSGIHVPEVIRGMKVSDIFGSNGDWNWSQLNWLPNDILDKLHSVLPPMEKNTYDHF